MDNPFSTSFPTSPADLKVHLQALLDGKERQLQQAGILGQRVLAQQTELEDRIRQLQDLDLDFDPDLDQDLEQAHTLRPEANDRYTELTELIGAWERENALLSSAFGPKVGFSLCSRTQSLCFCSFVCCNFISFCLCVCRLALLTIFCLRILFVGLPLTLLCHSTEGPKWHPSLAPPLLRRSSARRSHRA